MKNIKFSPLIIMFFSLNSYAVFKDSIGQSGIDFKHFNGMSGEFYFHEMMGAGAAFLDYDNDGDLDIYLVQGHMLGDKGIEEAIFAPDKEETFTDKLYRNDTTVNGIKFVDVTKQAGIMAKGYGMGVTVGDIDNDGDVDIYLSNFGDNQLWSNNGDGTFKDVTKESNTNNSGWSVIGSFTDINNDGFLDLYVVNYVDYDTSTPIKCKSYDGALDYCSPQGFKATSDSLFLNNQDGSFSNITAKAGINQEQEPGLGVVSADFNKDGWQDFYIANDGRPNILWLNNKRNGFLNKAMMSGVAVNMSGVSEASMGVDAADYDNDGDIDLFMTHLNRQTNTLYVNNGKGWFSDASVRMGLAASSFRSTGFGTLWFDYDNDGFLDLFSANGAVIKEPEQVKNKSKFPLKQVNQIWRNNGEGKFIETTKDQDESFLRPAVSRAAAFGDVDNDGDIDILVSNNAGVPQLLINGNQSQNNWIGLKLKREELNRDDYNAMVEVSIGKKTIYRQLKHDGSYVSSHDPRIVIGLGKESTKPKVKIKWSDGIMQTLESKEIILNKYTTIIRKK